MDPDVNVETVENGNGSVPGIPDGAVLLPKVFVDRIQVKLGKQDFELEFLRGQVASLEEQIILMNEHIAKQDAAEKTEPLPIVD